jgi:hypothetical protein
MKVDALIARVSLVGLPFSIFLAQQRGRIDEM